MHLWKVLELVPEWTHLYWSQHLLWPFQIIQYDSYYTKNRTQNFRVGSYLCKIYIPVYIWGEKMLLYRMHNFLKWLNNDPHQLKVFLILSELLGLNKAAVFLQLRRIFQNDLFFAGLYRHLVVINWKTFLRDWRHPHLKYVPNHLVTNWLYFWGRLIVTHSISLNLHTLQMDPNSLWLYQKI